MSPCCATGCPPPRQAEVRCQRCQRTRESCAAGAPLSKPMQRSQNSPMSAAPPGQPAIPGRRGPENSRPIIDTMRAMRPPAPVCRRSIFFPPCSLLPSLTPDLENTKKTYVPTFFSNRSGFCRQPVPRVPACLPSLFFLLASPWLSIVWDPCPSPPSCHCSPLSTCRHR